MLVLVVIAAAAGCLLIGLLTGQTPLSWVALGLSVVGLLLLAGSPLLSRRGSDRRAEDQDKTAVEREPAAVAAVEAKPTEAATAVDAKPVEAAVDEKLAAAASGKGKPAAGKAAEAPTAEVKPAASARAHGKPAAGKTAEVPVAEQPPAAAPSAKAAEPAAIADEQAAASAKGETPAQKPAEVPVAEQPPAAASSANGKPAEPAAPAEKPVEAPAAEKPEVAASTNGKPAGASPARAKAPRKSAKAKEPSVSSPAPEQSPAQASSAESTGADQLVRVIPGRRRFHVDGCRFLAGRESEEIGLDRARNEGYSACSVCIPKRASLVSAIQ